MNVSRVRNRLTKEPFSSLDAALGNLTDALVEGDVEDGDVPQTEPDQSKFGYSVFSFVQFPASSPMATYLKLSSQNAVILLYPCKRCLCAGEILFSLCPLDHFPFVLPQHFGFSVS